MICNILSNDKISMCGSAPPGIEDTAKIAIAYIVNNIRNTFLFIDHYSLW